MTTSPAALRHECNTFVRYLAQCEPSPYVVDQYIRAHAILPAMEEDGFGARLVAFAGTHSTLTFMADAFARFFAPRGLLRKKLVLLVAILEVTPPYFHGFIGPPSSSRPVQAVTLVTRLLLFGLALVAGTIILLPLQLLSARNARVAP